MKYYSFQATCSKRKGCEVKCTTHLPEASALSIQTSAAGLLHHGCLHLRFLRTAFVSLLLVFCPKRKTTQKSSYPPRWIVNISDMEFQQCSCSTPVGLLSAVSAVKAALLPADLLPPPPPHRSPRSWQRSACDSVTSRQIFQLRGSPVTPASSRRRPLQRRWSGVKRRCSGVCLILLDGGVKAHATTAHSSASSFILRFAGSFSPSSRRSSHE